MNKITEWFSRLTRNPSKAQLGLLLFVLLFLGSLATQCRAEPVAQFELGSTVARGIAPVAGLTVIWPDAGPKDADFECGVQLVGTSTFKDQDQSNQAALQCLLVDGYKKLDLGLGVVYLQNIDGYNGTHTNFSLKLGYRITDRFSLSWRHWSNAGTAKPNYGRDMLVLGYRF